MSSFKGTTLKIALIRVVQAHRNDIPQEHPNRSLIDAKLSYPDGNDGMLPTCSTARSAIDIKLGCSVQNDCKILVQNSEGLKRR